MARKYNFLYRSLVKDERDVVGHIAYALYKDSKIKHIEQFKVDHDGNEPTEDDLEHFHRISCQEDQIERYRIQASTILQDFLDNTLAETTAQIEEQTRQRHFNTIQQIVSASEKRIKPKSFLYGVGQSALGSFVLMLALAGLMLFFILSSHEITFTVGNGGVRKIQESAIVDNLCIDQPIKNNTVSQADVK